MSVDGMIGRIFRPYKGAVYRLGLAIPEPEFETANGRRLFTVHQMEKMAVMAAESEREACAKACESEADEAKYNGVEAACLRIAEKIRKRSNA